MSLDKKKIEKFCLLRKFIPFAYKFLQSFFNKVFGLYVHMLSKD